MWPEMHSNKKNLHCFLHYYLLFHLFKCFLESAATSSFNTYRHYNKLSIGRAEWRLA